MAWGCINSLSTYDTNQTWAFRHYGKQLIQGPVTSRRKLYRIINDWIYDNAKWNKTATGIGGCGRLETDSRTKKSVHSLQKVLDSRMARRKSVPAGFCSI